MTPINAALPSGRRVWTRREALALGGATLLAAGLAGAGMFDGGRAFAGEAAEPADPAAQPGPSPDGQSYLYAFPDRLSGLWGFVDAVGAVVIEPAFPSIASEPGSTMGVCPPVPIGMGGAAGAADVDLSAAIGVPGGVFWGSLMAVQDAASGLWGYIDRTGAWAIQPAYAAACTFNEGMAVVQGQDGLYSYIHEDGSMAFTLAEAIYATCFCDGLAFAQGNKADDGWGCIDANGQWALDSAADATAPYCYGSYIVFHEGLGAVGRRFVDATGATVVDFGADFYNGLSIASEDVESACYRSGKVALGGWVWDQTGWAVGTGEESIDPAGGSDLEWMWDAMGLDKGSDQFDGGPAPFATERFAGYSEGLCAAPDGRTGFAGYADEQAAWAVSPRFGDAKPMGGGYAFASDAATGDYGIVDASGSWVVAPRYSGAGCPAGSFSPSFYGGVGYAHVLTSGGAEDVDLCGWVNTAGTWVRSWPTYYDASAEPTATEGLAEDPWGRWSGAEVFFDEAAQTCTASAPVASPGWFETVSGEPVTYTYAYRDGAWIPTGADESALAATYENLVGTYELDGSQEDRGGGALTSLTVGSVDAEGNVAATFAWKSVYDREIERTATLAGKAVASTEMDGTRRVTVTLTGTTDSYGGMAACSFYVEHRVDGSYEDGTRSITYKAGLYANVPEADDQNYQGYSCSGTLVMPQVRSATL